MREGGGPWANVKEYGDFIKYLSPSGGGNVGTYGRLMTTRHSESSLRSIQGSKLTGVLLPGACKICLGQLKSLG